MPKGEAGKDVSRDQAVAAVLRHVPPPPAPADRSTQWVKGDAKPLDPRSVY